MAKKIEKKTTVEKSEEVLKAAKPKAESSVKATPKKKTPAKPETAKSDAKPKAS